VFSFVLGVRRNHYRGGVSVRDSSMATPASIELRFRLPDGNDIGPNNYTEAANVATLKEHVIEQWPKGYKSFSPLLLVNLNAS